LQKSQWRCDMFLSDMILPAYEFCLMRKFMPGEHHVTRCFNYSVLILMLSGRLDFIEDGRHIELKRGEYYIQRPGLFQEGKYPSDIPEYFYVHFNGTFSEKSGVPLYGTFNPDELMSHIETLNKYEQSGFASLYIKNATFYAILDKLKLNKSSLDKQIAKYLHENFTASITIDELSQKFAYSPNHIINVFKSEYGMTPHKYVNKLRLERAKQLLLTTTLSTDSIAYQSGFSDYTTFYRNFFSDECKSPAQWKNEKLLQK